jgi:hypothetical protein
MNTDIIESPAVYKANSKRNVLIAITALVVASSIAGWLAVVSEPVYSAVAIFTALGYTVGTLIWCHIDARERGISLGPGFRFLAILLGPLALIYYLFRSRGFARGFIAVGWMLAFVVILFVVNIVVNVVLALISDRLGLLK